MGSNGHGMLSSGMVRPALACSVMAVWACMGGEVLVWVVLGTAVWDRRVMVCRGELWRGSRGWVRSVRVCCGSVRSGSCGMLGTVAVCIGTVGRCTVIMNKGAIRWKRLIG